MMARLARIITIGILCGTLVGVLIGAYVITLTETHVIRRDDYAHPLFYEQSQSRYTLTVLVAFAIVFAAIGPYVAAATFGPWIRSAVYGLVAGVAGAIAVALLCAAITNQQPFNSYKGAQSSAIDFARIYAIPVALIISPAIGILISMPHFPGAGDCSGNRAPGTKSGR